ncbi:hypothetical protein [Tepidiforma thermophila]|uniref:Uncharacterized protein n=1 Tax=Tepidiforma thermophila (strain KCTC 52669 / CGMCC 1.13589 / G233) TaxID=2761530 RepID=A0A2A9HCL8_TEPT2|nr:hypothetical protein [Tepidiforma thermophila]PFG73757.1 hypothetical protein A9A59_0961 [Tepidiforma thermophila]
MITFERECRTPHSESYTIFEDGSIVGRVDLHYQGTNVYATLCTTADADEERIQQLIDATDEQLVMTADPYREDFIVTVWRGSPAGVYSDNELDDDEEDEDTFRLN